MDWDRLLLDTLHASRPSWDEPPDWRSVLSLCSRLDPEQAAALDRHLIDTISIDYRNPASDHSDTPFDDVMVNLPAGMHPDDLLCLEAAVMAAAERGLGGALFAYGRLIRSPRWHAMYPRFHWLGRAMGEVQQKLSATRAGRFLGGMLGLAAGDALGVTLEFMSREEIRRRFPQGHRELKGGGPFGFKAGEWSDDTAMALAVARGIAESPADPVDAVGRHFMAWYESSPPDVGATCRMALEAYRRDESWAAATETVQRTLGERAGGNGALMRTLPAALAYGKKGLAQALRVARMTHPHPESDAAVTAYQIIVDALLAGAPKAEAVAAGLMAAPALSSVNGRLPRLTEAEVRSTGYVVDTLEAALWCFLATDSLEDCLVTAAALGDDADTVAAVAGGLAGVHYGPLALPRRWSALLTGRDQLEDAAERLYALSPINQSY